MPNVIFSGYRAYVRARGRKKNNYYSNPSNMVKDTVKEKDSERKARLAKEAAAEKERENRERRLTARAVSNSLGDGLAGAAAAATAAAMGGAKSGKGARVSSVSSPPRNDRDKSAEAESPLPHKGRRSSGGRRVSPAGSSQENRGRGFGEICTGLRLGG